MFFFAPPTVATLRFFCIISWSSPVMAMVMNIPANTCFRKNPSLRQSSVQDTRHPAFSESCVAPFAMPGAWTMYTMVPTKRPEHEQGLQGVGPHDGLHPAFQGVEHDHQHHHKGRDREGYAPMASSTKSWITFSTTKIRMVAPARRRG
jgi:hypothetical protein